MKPHYLTKTPLALAAAMAALVDAGVLEEISGKKRDRSFGYAGYLDLLKTGTGLER